MNPQPSNRPTIQSDAIQARLNPATVMDGAAAVPPEWIMYMPAGTHTIHARRTGMSSFSPHIPRIAKLPTGSANVDAQSEMTSRQPAHRAVENARPSADRSGLGLPAISGMETTNDTK